MVRGFAARALSFSVVQMVVEIVLVVVAVGIYAAVFGILDGLGLFAGVARDRLAVVNALAGAGLSLAALAFGARVIERRPVTKTGLVRDGAIRGLLLGLAGGACLIGAVVGVTAVFGWYRVDSVEPLERIPAVLFAPFAALLGGAVVEEVVARAIVFRLLERSIGSWLAVATSASVFGLLHLMNPNATLAGAAAIALTAGLILAGLFMVTRSLWPVIGLHWGWNLFEGPVLGMPVSGLTPSGPVVHAGLSADAPVVWSGGAFGPEASLTTVIICVAVGAVLLVLASELGRVVAPSWSRHGALAAIA